MAAGAYDAVSHAEADERAGALSFHLSRPAAELLNKMTSLWHVVVPQELVEDPALIDWRNASRGTGPYALFLSAPGQQWKLKRNSAALPRGSSSGAPLPRWTR